MAKKRTLKAGWNKLMQRIAATQGSAAKRLEAEKLYAARMQSCLDVAHARALELNARRGYSAAT